MEIVICFSLATFVIIHVRRNINMHDFPQQITLDVLHFDFPKNKTKKTKKKERKRDNRLINESSKISLLIE